MGTVEKMDSAKAAIGQLFENAGAARKPHKYSPVTVAGNRGRRSHAAWLMMRAFLVRAALLTPLFRPYSGMQELRRR